MGANTSGATSCDSDGFAYLWNVSYLGQVIHGLVAKNVAASCKGSFSRNINVVARHVTSYRGSLIREL